MKARVEEVIAEEMAEVDAVLQDVKARCQGKTAMLFVGGSRAHHYQLLFNEIGMKTSPRVTSSAIATTTKAAKFCRGQGRCRQQEH